MKSALDDIKMIFQTHSGGYGSCFIDLLTMKRCFSLAFLVVPRMSAVPVVVPVPLWALPKPASDEVAVDRGGFRL
jgi:hypothetical protein